MPTYRRMDAVQRKCYDAARDGFYLAGSYRIRFADHVRHISADSVKWLAKDIHDWYSDHLGNHADSHIIVQFVGA